MAVQLGITESANTYFIRMKKESLLTFDLKTRKEYEDTANWRIGLSRWKAVPRSGKPRLHRPSLGPAHQRLSGLPSSLPTNGASPELAYGDVIDYPSLLDACSDCDIIFHTAALVEPWLPDHSRFFSVNVGGLKNLLQAAKETKTINKIIYTSSFFAVGPTDGYIADENQIHPEKVFCTEYEKSKAAADKVALQAIAEGIPIIPVYPGVIYGPGKLTTGNVVAQLLIERFNWRLPGYIGRGNDKFSFSHVDDVVEGHIAAMEKGRIGDRYLLTGENVSFMHVFDIAAIITGTARPKFNIPLGLIEVYGWISVLFARITGKLPLISPPV
ncbi:hypothetical protein ES319_A05G210500v1 [Gossypium barbadense]|uniref:NAD-dependent epimerase/dehydratase domain-containing protein n=1 Tax=Gossypium barbadense TaxID=3634 RepID=A0A5J5VRX9_GOSBA|nr:hypothetical protein ES319_A05G210500v1 [Gossypium barbadense]